MPGLLALAVAGVWLNVPFVHQDHNGCGPAVAAMLLRYWGHAEADRGALWRELNLQNGRRVQAADLVRFLERNHFRAFAFQGSWRDLRPHLEKRRPLVVATGKPAAAHYAVVAGIDEERGLIFLNDPARRRMFPMDRASFERQWRQAGNWTLLAVPAAP